jgi:hypothetical protein
VVQDGRLRKRVHEPFLRIHPRRSRRHEDVADERQDVRREHPVPDAGERVVSEQVDPQERKPEDGELRQPVGHVDGVNERAGLRDHVLEIDLDKGVECLLGVDDQPAVLERLEGPAVGDSARDLVGEDEPEPERELENEVPPAAGEEPATVHPAILARE